MMRKLYDHDQVPFQEETSRRASLLLMNEPRAGMLWVLEAEGSMAGYVVQTHGFSLEFGGWHGFIDELFIDEPFRGMGFGTAAVHHVEQACAAQGMTALLLEADLQNERATRLYRSLGFHEHSRRLMMLAVNATAQPQSAQPPHSA